MHFTFKEVGSRISNWGRWGSNDEKGTLNFVTPATVLAAAKCIRTGRCFELSIPLSSDGPNTGQGNRVNPIHLMNILPPDFETADGIAISDDYVIMPLQSGTQWDGLAHVGYDEYLYNGVRVSTISALGGCSAMPSTRACRAWWAGECCSTSPGSTGRSGCRPGTE